MNNRKCGWLRAKMPRVGFCGAAGSPRSWDLTNHIPLGLERRLEPPSRQEFSRFPDIDCDRELKRHECRAPFAGYGMISKAARRNMLSKLFGSYGGSSQDDERLRDRIANCNVLEGWIASCIVPRMAKKGLVSQSWTKPTLLGQFWRIWGRARWRQINRDSLDFSGWHP